MNSRTLILAAVLVIVAIAGYLYMMPEVEVRQSEPAAATSEPAPASEPATTAPSSGSQ
jgi:flagellar basal body-associated protein FliL